MDQEIEAVMHQDINIVKERTSEFRGQAPANFTGTISRHQSAGSQYNVNYRWSKPEISVYDEGPQTADVIQQATRMRRKGADSETTGMQDNQATATAGSLVFA